MSIKLATVTDEASLASLLTPHIHAGQVLIVGVTGSVAAGKSTLTTRIKRRLDSRYRVEMVSTDGFLLPNAELEAAGLALKKGYPESYDIGMLSGALQRARLGPVRIPGYSHVTYDVDAALGRSIDRPDLLLVEGLGLSPRQGGLNISTLLDVLIYLDANEEDLENWFVARFMTFRRQAEFDANSFYVKFREMTDSEAEAFARSVWRGINLPNLREHILPARDVANIVVQKQADHTLRLLRS